MAQVRGTSNAPMVLGIIGGVLGLPAAICSGVCASAASLASNIDATNPDAITNAANTAAAGTFGSVFLYIGLLGSILAIVFACFAKKNPKLAGIMLAVATVLNGVTLVTFNIFSLAVVILLLIATIICFTQKKETIAE